MIFVDIKLRIRGMLALLGSTSNNFDHCAARCEEPKLLIRCSPRLIYVDEIRKRQQLSKRYRLV